MMSDHVSRGFPWLASTFSIVGRAEGLLGVAVSSCVPACGGRCPYVMPGVFAGSTQAYFNPYLPRDVEMLVRGGLGLADAVEQVLAEDPGRDWRQFIAMPAEGPGFAFTGPNADDWAGHAIGHDCVAAGNILVGSETVEAMVDAFDASADSLPGRLVTALERGDQAGGDRRGRQSAGLVVFATEDPPFIDLRVDDARQPVEELRRLWALYDDPLWLVPFLRQATDRTPLDAQELAAQQAAVREMMEATRR